MYAITMFYSYCVSIAPCAKYNAKTVMLRGIFCALIRSCFAKKLVDLLSRRRC